MRINDYNTIFMFFQCLKRLTGTNWSKKQHLSLLSATFPLWMFLMVSSFQGNLEIKLQKAQNKCIRFCQNLPPRSLFRKINRLVFKYWNGIVPGYIHEMFNSSVDIAQDHRWYRTYLCGKQIQGKKAYTS